MANVVCICVFKKGVAITCLQMHMASLERDTGALVAVVVLGTCRTKWKGGFLFIVYSLGTPVKPSPQA